MQLSYVDADRCVRAGCDLQLALMGLSSPRRGDHRHPDGRQAMRSATHNILYMTANSAAEDIAQPYVPYWLYITAGVVDVVLLGLCVAYFVRRHQKMKAWKAANTANK